MSVKVQRSSRMWLINVAADKASLLSSTFEAHGYVVEQVSEKESSSHRSLFVSRSPKMLQMWNVAATVARTDVPVLILGESGVGKEVVARFLGKLKKWDVSPPHSRDLPAPAGLNLEA